MCVYIVAQFLNEKEKEASIAIQTAFRDYRKTKLYAKQLKRVNIYHCMEERYVYFATFKMLQNILVVC